MHLRFLLVILFATIALQLLGKAHAQTYTTSGNQIQSNGANWCGGGIDAFDQFGPTNTSGHGVKIVREVVENFSSCIMGSGTQSWNGSVLHGLQDVVNNNRSQGEITILCVYSWDSSGAITGGDPSNSSSYPWFSNGQYASQLAAMAIQFKGQSDVWIDPWNEPNFSSQSDWNSCVTTMYNAIRNTGNTNIILIPTNSWDSDESDYINGTGWHSGRSNVTGTIHIYSGWDWDSAANIQNRLQTILNTGWPILVGEIGPDNYQSDPIRGIQATIAAHVPTLAWNWDSNDGDQLQSGGTLTAWGNEWFAYIGQYTPSGAAPAAPTGLTATGGNAKVSLSWNPSPGATSYSIYRGTTANGESGTPVATGITTTSDTNTGLTNGTTYYYKVAAVNGYSTSGYSNEASAKPAAGSLSGSEVTAAASTYRLTSLGTTDWAHWNNVGFTHKSSGGTQISNVTQVGGGSYGSYSISTRNVSWTDGTPTSGNSDDHYYIWCNGTTGKGWTFTAPAGTAAHTLYVLCGDGGSPFAAIKVNAHLSDGSAADYTNTQTTTAGANLYLYTITYNAASAGQTLTITLTKNDSNSGTSVDLDAAWLQ